jgi:hypothetical protein
MGLSVALSKRLLIFLMKSYFHVSINKLKSLSFFLTKVLAGRSLCSSLFVSDNILYKESLNTDKALNLNQNKYVKNS